MGPINSQISSNLQNSPGRHSMLGSGRQTPDGSRRKPRLHSMHTFSPSFPVHRVQCELGQKSAPAQWPVTDAWSPLGHVTQPSGPPRTQVSQLGSHSLHLLKQESFYLQHAALYVSRTPSNVI